MSTCRRLPSPCAALGCAVLLAVAACNTDSQFRDRDRGAPPAEPARFESRTGVPILMDIPVIGFLFCRTTVVR